MKANRMAILYHKINNIYLKGSVLLLKCRGLKIGKGTAIGVINCNWPNKITLGSNCELQEGIDFRIQVPFSDSCFIKLGDNVFIGHACEFSCNSNISIGNNCLIASKTTFNDTGHEYFAKANINKQDITTKAIILEEDVWIGTSCVILQGVTIGKGAVIGAGSVVNKSIPPYEVWAGVPARFIKKRI
jgi:acetyltransferase-like isoleucine patch superfamily enzyme